MEERTELDKIYKEFERKAAFTDGIIHNFLETKERLESEVYDQRHELQVLESLAMVMDKFIDLSNEETLNELKDMINQGLKLAFPRTALTIDAKYRVKNNSQIIEFFFYKNGFREDLKDAQSGGVLDLVSFLLRVLVIYKMNYQRILFLDEALNGISDRGEYASKASTIIRGICEKKGFTVLLVTHKENLSSDAHHYYEGDKIDGDASEGTVDSLVLRKVE